MIRSDYSLWRASFCGLVPYWTDRISHHHHYLCTLPADNAENWITGWIPLWVTWLATNRKTFFPPLSNQNPSGFYTFSHCLATTFCSSLVLPSLFAPLTDLHGRLPVYVRRASSQSAVKAVILLVAIYYPVVCLKKDWKLAKPGAGCWVSRHTKLHTRVHNWPTYNTSLPYCLWKCVYVPVCYYFLSCCSLGEVFIYLLIVFLTAQQDLHADIF